MKDRNVKQVLLGVGISGGGEWMKKVKANEYGQCTLYILEWK
jgi:hypothetical protein